MIYLTPYMIDYYYFFFNFGTLSGTIERFIAKSAIDGQISLLN